MTVHAKGCDTGRCEDSRSSVCESSSSISCIRDSCCEDDFFPIPGQGKCENKCKKIIDIGQFICCCDRKAPVFNCVLPYLEFANAAQFLVKIPNARRLLTLITKGSVGELEKIASRAECFRNYEAHNAIFYNADAASGLQTRRFDTNFILFFLNRFQYYLNITFIEKLAIVGGNDLVCPKTKKHFDLLCLPPQYANITYGSDANAARIFNTIISDTTITKDVTDFIDVLIGQIEVCAKLNTTRNGNLRMCTDSTGNLEISCLNNTYNVYMALLTGYLEVTRGIVSNNLQQKINFISPQKQFAFVMYVTPSSSIPPSNVFSIFALDPSTYMTLTNTARFV